VEKEAQEFITSRQRIPNELTGIQVDAKCVLVFYAHSAETVIVNECVECRQIVGGKVFEEWNNRMRGVSDEPLLQF
jgi:hypothetical protein